MTGILVKREKLDAKADVLVEEVKRQGEGYVKSEAGSRVPVNHQEPRESTELTSLTALGKNKPCPHPDFGRLASRTVRY